MIYITDRLYKVKMFKREALLTAIIFTTMILAGCVTQVDNDPGNKTEDIQSESVEVTILSPEYRQASEWESVNYYMRFLGVSANTIMQTNELSYFLYLNGQEYLRRSYPPYCYFEFENKTWESNCNLIYCDPQLLLFGLYDSSSEDEQYDVELIKEYLGDNINWGIDSGQNYFQYSFTDISVRFYVDREKRTLLRDSYVLIFKETPEKESKLFTGMAGKVSLSENILDRYEWQTIHAHKNELGKEIDEIDAYATLRYIQDEYCYINIESGIKYGFGADALCNMVIFPVQELFPDEDTDISIEELSDYLKVDLVWDSYDDNFIFIVNDFIFFLPADSERNVLIKGNIIMKSRAPDS